MSSAERMAAVLLTVHERDYHGQRTSAAYLAHDIGLRHAMEKPRYSLGRGATRSHSGRQHNDAVRVTPAVTALRKRELIALAIDGDVPTAAGDAVVREARAVARSHDYETVWTVLARMPLPEGPARVREPAGIERRRKRGHE